MNWCFWILLIEEIRWTLIHHNCKRTSSECAALNQQLLNILPCAPWCWNSTEMWRRESLTRVWLDSRFCMSRNDSSLLGWRKWRLCSTHYGPVTRNYSYDHKRWKKLAQVSLWRLVERNDDFWLQTAIDKTIVFSTTKTVIILCITFALKEERHVSWWRQTVLTSLSNFDLMHATETWKVQVKPRWIKCRRQLS